MSDPVSSPPNPPGPPSPAVGRAFANLASAFTGLAPLLAMRLPEPCEPGKVPATLPWGSDFATGDTAMVQDHIIGVWLQPNSPLLALAFSQADTAQTFINSTPALAGVLVTGFRGSTVVWLNVTDPLPATTVLPGVTVITSGIVPLLACDGSANICSVTQWGKPAETSLASINFESPLRELFLPQQLAKCLGEPFSTSRPNRGALNVQFFAVYVSNIARVSYHRGRRVFLQQLPGSSTATVLPEDSLTRMIAGVVNLLRGQMPDIPARANHISSIKSVVHAMKTLAATGSEDDEDEVTVEFVRTRLERRPGATVLSTEIGTACNDFRVARGLPPKSKWVLHKVLNREIRSQHGGHQSCDLIRNGKAKRGFHGLALRSPPGDLLEAQEPPCPTPQNHVHPAGRADPPDKLDTPYGVEDRTLVEAGYHEWAGL